MRINAIRTDGADMSVDVNELICLGNVLYFYEKHWDANSGFAAPGQVFHAIAKQIVTARDIAQYGRLDGHSISLIAAHELDLHPDEKLASLLSERGRLDAAPAQGRLEEDDAT